MDICRIFSLKEILPFQVLHTVYWLIHWLPYPENMLKTGHTESLQLKTWGGGLTLSENNILF